ncbi:MAG: DUF2520 domain-containing protein [Dehalococcoidia bacterium]|nr:DUF2520 domain-containing protein [Dehalococcoidia bacterium]
MPRARQEKQAVDLPRAGIIGAGTLGTVLASVLVRCGYPLAAVAGRSRASTERLARAVQPHPQVCATPQQAADLASLIFITTPDDAIESVAASVRWSSRHAVVHCSGALDASVLDAVRRAGGQAGGFHPMQTFAAGQPGLDAPLAGVTIGIEAEGQLRDTLAQLAQAMGCPWVALRPQDKALYHLSATLVSNYVVTLADAATSLWERLGLSREQARAALLPLLEGTVRGIAAAGTPAALTGPIARGDAGTIQRHLAALRRHAPELLPVYRALGERTVPLALANRSLDSDAAAAIQRLLQATPADAPQHVEAIA